MKTKLFNLTPLVAALALLMNSPLRAEESVSVKVITDISKYTSADGWLKLKYTERGYDLYSTGVIIPKSGAVQWNPGLPSNASSADKTRRERSWSWLQWAEGSFILYSDGRPSWLLIESQKQDQDGRWWSKVSRSFVKVTTGGGTTGGGNTGGGSNTTAPEIDVQSVDGTGDFGAVLVGAYLDRTFTIKNTGKGELRLTGNPRAALSSSTHFRVYTQPPATVGAGRSTTFTVRFQPTTSGSFSSKVTIANNDADENPYTFIIKGTTDDHGNTTSTATVLTTYGSYAGKLEQQGDMDFFGFKLGSTTTVTLRTTGTTDTYGYLFNSAGGLITSDNSGNGSPNFKIVCSLPAGFYYLKVTGYSGTATGAYSMTISR